MKQAWLRYVDWQTVVDLNAHLCTGGGALHKPTSDGYEATKTLWEASQTQELTLAEAVEVCRRAHKMAPFCNFNGNTFVAIIRDVLRFLPDASAPHLALLRSLTGHMVAGTATDEEISEFNGLLDAASQGGARIASDIFSAGDQVQTPNGSLTGVVIRINADGGVVWKCDQTGASMAASTASLRFRK